MTLGDLATKLESQRRGARKRPVPERNDEGQYLCLVAQLYAAYAGKAVPRTPGYWKRERPHAG